MLVKEFEELHRTNNQSQILISHQERIIKMADRIMVVDNGKIAHIGSKEEILPILLHDNNDNTSCKCINKSDKC